MAMPTPHPAPAPDPAADVDGWFARAMRGLLPPRCLLCGAPGSAARDLCAGCEQALPCNRDCCARCALPLARSAPLCGACLAEPPPWDEACVPLRYEDPLDTLVLRFKFGADLAAGRLLSQRMAEALATAARPAAIVPVPLSRRRLAGRGYNQAQELARLVARALRLPLAPRALRRIRDTDAQAGLDAGARRRNLRGAFAADPAAALQGLHLALFDDVVTTGATAAECARVLRAAGAARISLWAVARAP
jgi:ComF family protein